MHTLPERLFTPAIDALTLTARWEYPRGWRMSVAHCHAGEGWSLCPVDQYADLVTEELLDVALAVLTGLLE